MNFVAIEFDNGVNGAHVKGYLRIPNDFNPLWHLGFRKYLSEKYQPTSSILIYPLRIHQDPNSMGKPIPGYKNMEDDFNMALRSNIYYPIGDETSNIRREWAMMDPRSCDFVKKNR